MLRVSPAATSSTYQIHGRALQNHTQILLVKEEDGNFCQITNSCLPTCSESLSYFCNDCNISGCSNCMLLKHKMHSYITLQKKNEDMMAEFNEVNQKIIENLQRVTQVKQKLKSTLMSTYEPEESDSVETKIAKHFAYLHGVLQNLEAKLMNHLHQRRNSLKNDLAEIRAHVDAQEEQLSVALTMASYTKDNFGKVDMRNAIQVLREMSDLPCHLLRNDFTEDEAILFNIDENIIAHLNNHCALQVPQVSRYQLVRTEALPEDYKMEPLEKDSSIADVLNQTLSSRTTRSPPSNVSVSSNVSSTVTQIVQTEKTDEINVDRHQVEVAYIYNPSSFYVHYLFSKPEYDQLKKDLQVYANSCDERPIELHQNDMCIVKERVGCRWHRGRVLKVKDVSLNNFPETLYTILYIDQGYKECHVPISRIRTISDKHLKLQPQAVRCCLHGIVPIKNMWSAKSTKDFKKLLRQTTVFMHIMKYTLDILYVDICTVSLAGNSMGPQSICNALIYMKHACNDMSISQMRPIYNTYVYNKEELTLNKTTDVTVNHVESPAEIYVSKRGKQNNLLKLLGELKEYYEGNTSVPIISTPKEGLPCVAQYTDDAWHRCEIAKVISENKVQVFYVDIGRTLTQNCDVLRAILSKYIHFKTQAIRISLMYVAADPDGKWKAESIDELSRIFQDVTSALLSTRKKTIDGYSACIRLPDIPDVSRLLKAKHLVNCWNSDESKRKIGQHDADIPESFDREFLSEEFKSDIRSVQEEETIKDPYKMEVYIKQMITPDCIYVTQAERKESNASFLEEMQQFYRSFCSEKGKNWNEGAVCVVYSAKDKSYLRAKILKIKSPEVLVYFYDLGIEETVTIGDVQYLHSWFAKQPAYCFKVKLAGILPCGGSSAWPSLSCSTLSDIIRRNARYKFYITKLVQQEVCDDTIPVELWVRQIKIPGPLAPSIVEINSINRMLIEEGVALPIKDYFSKARSVYVAEFKRQLLDSHMFVSCDDDIKWLNKEICRSVNCEIDDSSTSHKYSLEELLKETCIVGKPKKEHSKRISDWLPALPITEEVFHAIPTYVDDHGSVYLHSVKQNSASISLIEKELQSHFELKEIQLYHNWKEGDVCIAQYHLNKRWYRGRIIQVFGATLKVGDRVQYIHLLFLIVGFTISAETRDLRAFQVAFVDYGNVEDCDVMSVSRDIKMEHIPIQCTKCVISGLSPETVSGNWTLDDLDRLHSILVDKKCSVSILQREPTHLVISIALSEAPHSDFLTCLLNLKTKVGMKIKIERKEWNDSIDEETSLSDSARNSVLNEEITNNEDDDTSKTSSLELETKDVMLKENVISGNSIEKLEYNDDKEILHFEDIQWPELFTSGDCMFSSTPQNESEEGSFFGEYKPLIIPPDTKYIEVILRCNRSPIISCAQLAENNDDMFSDVLHNYYLQYEAVTLDIQQNAAFQPLIESFESNISCVAKFTDGEWYRCVIMRSQRLPNSNVVRVMLHYIDYGNSDHKDLNLSDKNHDLRLPKKEWMEVPAMAFECKFWNINFVSDDVNLLADKLNEIYNKVVVAKIKEIHENMLVAEMYENNICQKLLYEQLIDEDLYQLKKSKKD
ncbi:PREDICTED: RING finger protein 17-like isoform X2 [Dinoponera quadriceps]|uniref:RING finger protein 17-like isoform X2 n=2 Tax=Dinoponera quadriceps TaxID=609295 RepID=A0A6P3XH00_DINQU|nr:PREDICTED: RING finger protein 17-like isoform X2 [Dinoponera quadriceps]